MNKKQNPTDRSLIMQYREGDTSVLSVLVKRYHKVFCQKAYWLTKDKEMAKDVAQESWIIIISKLETLEQLDSFKSWAFRIVYTKGIDALKRRNKERNELEASRTTETDKTKIEDEQKSVEQELLKAIHQLPKEKQDIIRLFYTESYTIHEISLFLKIPAGTVKSRLFKAREKLKSILKK